MSNGPNDERVGAERQVVAVLLGVADGDEDALIAVSVVGQRRCGAQLRGVPLGEATRTEAQFKPLRVQGVGAAETIILQAVE